MDDISEHIERYRWIRELTEKAMAQRLLKTEFHGLEEELSKIQSAALESYAKSKAIKHPRDKGDHREEILRHLLRSTGVLPAKYSIAEQRVRAVSTTGHISPELDLVFYDAADCIVLKRFPKTLDYMPIEAIHGTVQVKSRLSKKALVEGLENIAAFKRMKTGSIKKNLGGLTLSTSLDARFGILFAYELDLAWDKIVAEIKGFATENPIELLPNAIHILGVGSFRIGDMGRIALHQREMRQLTELVVHGNPDIQGDSLLRFYGELMDLLSESSTGQPDIWAYMRVPLTAGPYSYHFANGATAETASCSKHGPYLKIIPENALKHIVDFSEKAERINAVRAWDLARGESGDNQEAYERQPGTVRIYNPDALPLTELLMSPDGWLQYEYIIAEGMHVWLPWYYVVTEQLINECPKCAQAEKRDRQRLRSRKVETDLGGNN